jgi:hypothetical protein
MEFVDYLLDNLVNFLERYFASRNYGETFLFFGFAASSCAIWSDGGATRWVAPAAAPDGDRGMD